MELRWTARRLGRHGCRLWRSAPVSSPPLSSPACVWPANRRVAVIAAGVKAASWQGTALVVAGALFLAPRRWRGSSRRRQPRRRASSAYSLSRTPSGEPCLRRVRPGRVTGDQPLQSSGSDPLPV